MEGKQLNSLAAHTDAINSISISPNGEYIATGSDDKLVKIWYGQTQKLIKTFSDHKKPITDVAFSPEGAVVASSSYDGKIMIWNLKDLKQLGMITKIGHTPHSIRFTPRNNQLIIGLSNGNLKLYDFALNSFTDTLKGHKNIISSLVISPDGRNFISGSNDKTIKV